MKKLLSILVCCALVLSSVFGFSHSAIAKNTQKIKVEKSKPYAGKQVDVTITNGGMKIAGTITYPKNISKRCPAILLLPGYMGERDELPVTGSAIASEGGKG